MKLNCRVGRPYPDVAGSAGETAQLPYVRGGASEPGECPFAHERRRLGGGTDGARVGRVAVVLTRPRRAPASSGEAGAGRSSDGCERDSQRRLRRASAAVRPRPAGHSRYLPGAHPAPAVAVVAPERNRVGVDVSREPARIRVSSAPDEPRLRMGHRRRPRSTLALDRPRVVAAASSPDRAGGDEQEPLVGHRFPPRSCSSTSRATRANSRTRSLDSPRSQASALRRGGMSEIGTQMMPGP
jgi:hypothetical protein